MTVCLSKIEMMVRYETNPTKILIISPKGIELIPGTRDIAAHIPVPAINVLKSIFQGKSHLISFLPKMIEIAKPKK
jgi:hypothetical protein